MQPAAADYAVCISHAQIAAPATSVLARHLSLQTRAPNAAAGNRPLSPKGKSGLQEVGENLARLLQKRKDSGQSLTTAIMGSIND
jgi:hypothetical protein